MALPSANHQPLRPIPLSWRRPVDRCLRSPYRLYPGRFRLRNSGRAVQRSDDGFTFLPPVGMKATHPVDTAQAPADRMPRVESDVDADVNRLATEEPRSVQGHLREDLAEASSFALVSLAWRVANLPDVRYSKL